MANRSFEAFKREREELRQLFGYWKTVSGSLTGLVPIASLGGTLLEPLLPGVLRVVAPVLSVVLSMLTILFLFYRYRDRTRREIDKVAFVLFVLGVVALMGFFVGWLTWIFEANGDWHMRGMALTEEAALVISQGKLPDDPKALLDRFGHDSEDRVWQFRNLVAGCLSLSFGAFFALVSGGCLLWTMKYMRPEDK